MKRISMLLFVIAFTVTVNAQQTLNKKDLQELKERMVGAFSSESQSKSDTSYFDIRLHMAQIWDKRQDGYWLYIEQAVYSSLAKPYRQRIYHIYQQDDTTFVSKVFELSSPLRFAGAWSNVAIFNTLTTDSLIDRKGCAIYLHKDKSGNYAGATPGKECLSSLRGATYATSEVIIKKDELISWDRGWNKEDKQLWGAVKGGYHFIKQPK